MAYQNSDFCLLGTSWLDYFKHYKSLSTAYHNCCKFKGCGMRKWGAHLVQSGVVQLDPTFGFSPRPISRVYFKWKADMASGLMGVPTIWYILPHIYLYTLALLIHTTFTIILHSSFQSLLLIYSDEHKRAKVGFTNHHEKKTRWDEFVFEIYVCGSPDVKRFCCS